MRYILFSLFSFLCLTCLLSCGKDEGKLPDISFISGTGYTSTSDSISAGGAFKIGINASKAEDKDVLKEFSITKSTNGGTGTSVYSHSMSGSEEDSYSYDFNGTASATAGTKDLYTFTVTNRDGLVNQVSLTVTAK